MQPADPLQQHVDRTQVGEQEIGIDVQTLFQRLGADDDAAAGRAVMGRQCCLHRLVQQPSVLRRETAVMQRRAARRGQQQVLGPCLPHRLEGGDGLGHRVADD